MPPVKDDGDANLDAALSGDTALHGAMKDQVAALGGELDDDLDNFKPTAADRGDAVEDEVDRDTPLPAKADDKAAPTDEDDESGEDDPAKKAAEDEEEDEDSSEESEASDEDGPAKDEPDETDDEEEDEEPPAKKSKRSDDDDDQRIPKWRFDEVNERRKQAEEELKALKAQDKAKEDAAKKSYDFDKAEDEYLELVLAGKTKEAREKRKEIRAAEKAEWQAEQLVQTESSVTAREVKRELDSLVADYEGRFAELNPKSKSYKPEYVDDALAVYNGYLADGNSTLTPAQAFRKAVDLVVKANGLKEAGKEDDSPKTKVVIKEKKDVKKKLEAAKKAPKDIGKAGLSGADKGEAEIDINNISDEEFDALPESTKKRLRGDTL